jgi:hypothetical protein
MLFWARRKSMACTLDQKDLDSIKEDEATMKAEGLNIRELVEFDSKDEVVCPTICGLTSGYLSWALGHESYRLNVDPERHSAGRARWPGKAGARRADRDHSHRESGQRELLVQSNGVLLYF